MSAIDVIEAVRNARNAPEPVICERFDNLGRNGAPRRIGIMGGTFDPIHNGHLVCAEQVREDFKLHAIIFIPTGQPVFKRGKKIASGQQRLAMCRGAIADNPFFDVSAIEVARGETPTPSTPFVRCVLIIRKTLSFSLSRAQTQLWTLKNGIIPNMFFQPSHFWRQQESMRRRIVRWMSRFPI